MANEKDAKGKELDQMAEDVKKAVGKDKEEIVAKTIAETRERMAKEKELSDMKAQLDAIEKSRVEETEKHKADLEALKGDFKSETEKLVKEFQDSRKSSVNTNNPFSRDETNSGTEPSLMERYNSDEVFQKQVDEESKNQFYDYLDKRHR